MQPPLPTKALLKHPSRITAVEPEAGGRGKMKKGLPHRVTLIYRRRSMPGVVLPLSQPEIITTSANFPESWDWPETL